MSRLKGKIAFVTGAASGIGEAIAHSFAKEGAHVELADINQDAAGKVAEAITTQGGSAYSSRLDVASLEDCRRCAADVLERYPNGIDVLVNNAGIGAVGTVLQTPSEELDRLHLVNVRGPYELSRLFLPAMIERRSGSIIHLASIGGVVGVRDRAAYCTTKFAIVGLTKSMALDHAGSNVRVNCLCPARVETPFVQARIREYPDPQKAYAEMCGTQPLGRMARPEEIAAAAVYLASDESAFVTGTAFAIDGGLSAGK